MTPAAPAPTVRLRNVLISSAVLSALAMLINALFGAESLATILSQGQPFTEQIGWGVTIALGVAGPIWGFTLMLRCGDPLRRQLVELVGRLDAAGFNPLWIGVLAGLGEELLFRGALQPIIGLWWCSVVFVALHFQSYQYRTFNWQKLVMALLAFLASLLLGEMFMRVGLVAAIVMHASFDVLGLFLARRLARKRAAPPTSSA